MNIDIINRFNHKVNAYDFVFFKYRDVEGKTNWNCICSSMQWIKLSVNAINEINFDIENIDVKCMELYKYISCIDIIIESLQQLHRIFHKDNSLKIFPNSNNIFKHKISQMNDNEYFKMIRAAYGAHPVNLDDPKSPNNKNLKRFASNPFDNKTKIWSDNRDFNVHLYTNMVNGKDIHFPIWLDELKKYANDRYKYLNVLYKRIDELYNLFINECKSTRIETSEDLHKQIDILISESKLRLNNSYYTDSLEFIKKTFSLICENENNNKILNMYKKDLKKVIYEIKDKLQDMNLVDLETNNYLDPCLDDFELPKMLHYSLEKLSNAYYGGSELFSQDPIEEFLKDIIDFSNVGLEERYILTHAGMSYIVNK